MILEFQKETALLGKISTGFTTHYYTEWEDGLGTDKVSLFLLVHVNSQQIESGDMTKEAFQLLQDHFLHQLERNPYDRFESALREINQLIREKQRALNLIFLPNLDMVVGVIQGETIYLSQRGDAAAYLVRKRHTSVVTEDLYDPKNLEDAFQNIANGDLEIDDTVLLSTGNLAQHFTAQEFTQFFSEQALHASLSFLQQDEEFNLEIESQVAILGFDILEKHEERMPVLIAENISPEKTENILQPLSKYLTEEPELIPSDPLEKEISKTLQEQVKQGVSQMDQGGRLALAHLRTWARAKQQWPLLDRFSAFGSKKQVAVLVVLGLFVFGSITGVYQYKSYQLALADMQADIDRAEAIVAQAEMQGTFDKDGAREQLTQASSILKALHAKTGFEKELDALSSKIEEVRLVLDGVQLVPEEELNVMVSAKDLLKDEKAVALVRDEDQWVIFSKTRAFPSLLDSLQSPVDLGASVQSAVYFADQNKVILSSDEAKVLSYSKSNAQFADTADAVWPSFKALADFSSRIYGLDLAANQIWRYTQGADSFSGKVAYLTDETDLTGAVSMAIDGQVWLLFEDGRISKFLSGKALDFTVLNAPIRSPKQAKKIVTYVGIGQIYVLDAGRNTVYVYDKQTVNNNIRYSGQFEFSSLKSPIVDIDYNIDLSQVYLLTEDGVLYAWKP